MRFIVLLMCFSVHLPEKAVPEVTYIVSGGTLNPTQLLTLATTPTS